MFNKNILTERPFSWQDVSHLLPKLGCETGENGRFYTTPEGKAYPSVTTIMGAGEDDWLDAWRQRVGRETADRIGRQACLRGTLLHDTAEAYMRNQEPDITSWMPHNKQMLMCLKKVLDEHVGKVYSMEDALYSDYLKLTGRVDCIAEYDGKLSIIDFKTSKRVKSKEDIPNYFTQTCAYAIMFEERTGIPVQQLVIAMMVEGEPKAYTFIENRDDWWPKLKNKLQTYYNT